MYKFKEFGGIESTWGNLRVNWKFHQKTFFTCLVPVCLFNSSQVSRVTVNSF
jgi:hypothetical protein